MKPLAVVLTLAILFGCGRSATDASYSSTPSSLVGCWCNELGSMMEIFESNEEGVLEGRYNSKVGDASSWYTLQGTYDKDGTESGGTIGWSVTYNNARHGNSKSTATWSGKRQMTADGNPVILTTWLLTTQTISSKNWESTLTNKDFFQRCSLCDDTSPLNGSEI